MNYLHQGNVFRGVTVQAMELKGWERNKRKSQVSSRPVVPTCGSLGSASEN